MGNWEFILAMITVNYGPFSGIVKKAENRLTLKQRGVIIMTFVLDN